MRKSLIWRSALELHDMVIYGDLSAVDLVETILERIDRVNPEINSIVTLNDNVRKEAENIDREIKKGISKPLSGIPITVKDNIYTKGLRTTYGSLLYKDFIPDEDSVLIKRIKEAGGIILGKTNLPEFALVAITDNPLFGVSRNPWDRNRTPGGSSGGSAASIAAGLGPVSIGNDGGGSIRIPSSFCGVYGFKPSTGVVPEYPALPMFNGISVNGPITRYVSDAALLMDIISGPDYHDRYSLGIKKKKYLRNIEGSIKDVKIAYSSDLGYAIVDPEVERIVRESAFKYRELEADVVEVYIKIPNMERELTLKVAAEFTTYIKDKFEDWRGVAFKPYLTFFTIADYISYMDYIKIEEKTRILWGKVMEIFREYDFLITPTVSIPAFKIEEQLGPSDIAGKAIGPIGWMPYTYPFNFTGQPAANIPIGLSKEKLPIGMQIVGRPYDDVGVLRLSKIYEDHYQWHSLRPAI